MKKLIKPITKFIVGSILVYTLALFNAFFVVALILGFWFLLTYLLFNL